MTGRMPRRISLDEIQLIISLAGQIGIAVENATPFEETRARANELSALYSVVTVLNQSLDITLVLHRLMHIILKILAFDAAPSTSWTKKKRSTSLPLKAVSSERALQGRCWRQESLSSLKT